MNGHADLIAALEVFLAAGGEPGPLQFRFQVDTSRFDAALREYQERLQGLKDKNDRNPPPAR